MKSTSHVIFGVLLYLLVFRIAEFDVNFFGLVAAIIGSLLPDIDIRTSYISKMWSRYSIWVVFLFIGGIIVANYLPVIETGYVSIGVLVVILMYPYALRAITRHRGLTHTYIYMIVVAIIIFLLFGWNLALAFGIGYFSHLIADRI